MKKNKQVSPSNNIKDNTIELNLVSFNRMANNFSRELSQTLNTSISVYTTQELLAKSLGFIDHYKIKKFFEYGTECSYLPSALGDFSVQMTAKNQMQLLLALSDSGNVSLHNRAHGFLNAVMAALEHMSNDKEIILDFDVIQEFSNLENIARLYKQRRDFPNPIRQQLKCYLDTIPGYKDNLTRQECLAIEYHSSIKSYFYYAFNVISQWKKADPLIINSQWYMAHYEDSESFSSVLDENISVLADQFSVQDWRKKFTEPTMSNTEKDTIDNKIYCKNNKNKALKSIGLIEAINDDYQTEHSWLLDSTYQELITYLFRTKEFKSFYLSELFVFCFSILNQEKREKFLNFLVYLVKNYETTLQTSARLNSLIK